MILIKYFKFDSLKKRIKKNREKLRIEIYAYLLMHHLTYFDLNNK